MRVITMALRGKLARAPSGSRAHFMHESRAMETGGRNNFGRRLAPLITREGMARERERQSEARRQTFEQAAKTREALGKFISWAREKLAPRREEVEFGGVRLSREESGALRKLVNMKKLSPREERMVGEALEKLVRKQGGKGELRRQAV